jgi:pyruvate-ferredoxin/flavodoxin oxidoreductase
MGKRVNTVLQTCFFAISGVLPRDRAVEAIRRAAKKTYASKGDAVVAANFAAIDAALDGLHEVRADVVTADEADSDGLLDKAPLFVKQVTAALMAGQGDLLPVSALPADGTFPTGTTRWEKRNIAEAIPVWDEVSCIQCNKCVFVCPHAAIRAKAYDGDFLEGAPATFHWCDYRGNEFSAAAAKHDGARQVAPEATRDAVKYTLQVAPEDCTGCELCIEVCPVKNKTTGIKALRLEPQRPLRDAERANLEFFLHLPEVDRAAAKANTVKGSQFLQPLFEYSGACTGCGETPYLKLATQLFGDRMVVANATGCSSIFGGNLPTTPWTCNSDGRGPAWANSLFEDNAEFGFGMRLTIDAHAAQAGALLKELARVAGEPLVEEILAAVQHDEPTIFEQRTRVEELKRRLNAYLAAPSDAVGVPLTSVQRLLDLADYLVKKSVWIVGGDGWAYDIGYGGLDHVLASDKNVNVLVLDTEVYSNTGGQASKSTPRGAVARFAAAGKNTGKKDLGLLAMMYGHVYVAHVALGASDTQTVKAFLEAEAYDGPSIIIAYAHCIAHGLEIKNGLTQQNRAVASGHWPLYRYDPRGASSGKFPLTLDSKAPKIRMSDYTMEETRYSVLKKMDREAAERLAALAQRDVDVRWQIYEQLAAMRLPS